MRYFSTFSGIGGFELAIHNADPTAECVGFSEIDSYASSIYQHHFPQHKPYGDITKIDATTLPDFDLLVGGFPCQAFSIAGKRGGFQDTRGTLFFEIARIAREKQPHLLVLENVKGLLSHDNGRTFHTILSTLDEIGYDAECEVLNSKYFGVPQNRERVFIVGHLRGEPWSEVFPLGGDTKEDTRIVGEDVSYNLDASYAKGTNTLADGRRQLICQRARGKNSGGLHDIAPTLTSNDYHHNNHVVRIPEATKKGYAEASVGQAINLSVLGSKTRRGRVSDVAQTLDTGMQQYTLTEEYRIRRLTPTECERLQGFPDSWTASVSDSQRYKTIGNAVTVNVIRDIMKKLLK